LTEIVDEVVLIQPTGGKKSTGLKEEKEKENEKINKKKKKYKTRRKLL
jgi:hypothetical protein